MVKASETSTICKIGSQIAVQGNIRGEGELLVEGQVVGTIVIRGHLVIADSGRVEADIEVESGDIYGQVQGDIQAKQSLTIHGGARVLGSIRAAKIHLHEGASVRGAIEMEMDLPEELENLSTSA